MYLAVISPLQKRHHALAMRGAEKQKLR